MNRILKIGMDVHSTNYTLCAMEPVIGAEDRVFANIQVTPDYKNIILFIEDILKSHHRIFQTAAVSGFQLKQPGPIHRNKNNPILFSI